jgi:predicted nucleic acid-binding protein
MSYLLDTNVVSEWVKPRPSANVIAWLTDADEDEIFISVCTLAELRFGVEWMTKGKRRDALDLWLRTELPARFDGRIVPVDIPIAQAWGTIQARGRNTGRPIEAIDGMIAATAETYEMTLVTRDIKHFEAVVTSLLNPWAEA